jgi:hypothetical protein
MTICLAGALLLPLAASLQRDVSPGGLSAQTLSPHIEASESLIVAGGAEDKVTPELCVTEDNPEPINVSGACTSGGDRCWPTSYILGVQKASTTSVAMALAQCGLASMAYSRVDYARCKKNVVCKETLHAPLDIRTDAGQSNFTQLYSSTYCCNPSGEIPCPPPQSRRGCETRHFMSAQPLRVQLRLPESINEPMAMAIGANESHKLAPVDQFDMREDPEASNNLANLVNALPKNLLPVVRFVLILREPVSRILSWYNHEQEELSVHRPRGSIYQNLNFHDYTLLVTAQVRSNISLVSDMITNASFLDNKWVSVLEKHGHSMMSRHFDRELYPDIPDELRTVSSLAADQPAFSKGVYVDFLTFFKMHPGLSRKQLLVISMDSLIDDPTEHMRLITTHYGLPVLTQMTRLLKTNERESPDRVVKPRCESRDLLAAAYRPYNAMLYQQLQHDRQSWQIPTNEPLFPEFDVEKSVACTEGPDEITAGDASSDDADDSSDEKRLEWFAMDGTGPI